jgi:hypothetical protein
MEKKEEDEEEVLPEPLSYLFLLLSVFLDTLYRKPRTLN